MESTLVEFHSHLLAETKETELRKGDASPPLRDKSSRRELTAGASSPAGELQDDAECRELSKSFCEEALQEQINSLSNRPNDAANLKALGKVYVHGAKHRANEKRSGNSLKREKSYKLVDPGLNEILSKVKPYKQNHLLDSTARTSKEQNKKSFKEVLQIPPVISPGFPASPSQPTGSKILYTHPAKNHAHPPPGARKEEPPSCTGLNHLLDVRDRNLSLEPPKKKERSLSEKVKKSEKGLPLVGIEGGQPKQEYMVKSGSEVRKSGNGEVAGKKPRGVKADTTPDTSFQTNSKTGKEIARNQLLLQDLSTRNLTCMTAATISRTLATRN